jgi:hypothetical protein
VLVLVGEQHLVDEPVGKQGMVRGLQLDLVEDVERALAHLVEVGAQLLTAQDRQRAANAPGVLDRVVVAAQLAVQRLPPANGLDQPQLLEVGDVPQVPGQRAEDGRVNPVQLLVGQRRDEL